MTTVFLEFNGIKILKTYKNSLLSSEIDFTKRVESGEPKY